MRITIFASLLLHLLVLALLRPVAQEPAPYSTPIEIGFDDRNTVVETDRALKPEKPSKKGYLSDRDQSVAEETRRQASPAANLSLADLGVSAEGGDMGPVQGDTGALDDFLPNVKDGAKTLLNARAYAQHAFITRMRQQLAPVWKKDIHEKVNALFLSGRTLGQKEYVTRVRAVLDSSGTLRDVSIRQTSGMDLLDAAALEAFRVASPFRNPPKQLTAADGLVEISWNFVVRQESTQLTLASPEEGENDRRRL